MSWDVRPVIWMAGAVALALVVSGLLGFAWERRALLSTAVVLLVARDRLSPSLLSLDRGRDVRALLALTAFMILVLLVGLAAPALR
jgi:hypothetical protein